MNAPTLPFCVNAAEVSLVVFRRFAEHELAAPCPVSMRGLEIGSAGSAGLDSVASPAAWHASESSAEK